MTLRCSHWLRRFPATRHATSQVIQSIIWSASQRRPDRREGVIPSAHPICFGQRPHESRLTPKKTYIPNEKSLPLCTSHKKLFLSALCVFLRASFCRSGFHPLAQLCCSGPKGNEPTKTGNGIDRTAIAEIRRQRSRRGGSTRNHVGR